MLRCGEGQKFSFLVGLEAVTLGSRPCTVQPRSRLSAVGPEAFCVAVRGRLKVCGDACSSIGDGLA
jgi:hypothetical protein